MADEVDADEEDDEDGTDAFLDETLPPASLLFSALSTSWATSFTKMDASSIIMDSENTNPIIIGKKYYFLHTTLVIINTFTLVQGSH